MGTDILEPMFWQRADILVPVWTHGRAFWCLVARLGTSMGILVPGCPFGKVGMCLGVRALSLVPGNVFGQASKHFGAQVPV